MHQNEQMEIEMKEESAKAMEKIKCEFERGDNLKWTMTQHFD